MYLAKKRGGVPLLDVTDWNESLRLGWIACTKQPITAEYPFFLVECIEMPAALMPDQHQTSFFEFFQMMADCWLIDFAIQLVNNIIHTQPGAAKMPDDFLPGVISHCFRKSNSIYTHKSYYIDVRQY